MTPIEYTKELWENQKAKIVELETSLKLISESYLRIRGLIPGAFDTPKAPTIEQVYHTTEQALNRFIQEHIRD